ncbi:hypothetical protein [Sorangium sp. So ce542]|uniref:hypothetical protein n=1 Tax=Sorangium sp. So ce542 TaxID=3133316 RepID=UPI003F62305B
MRLDTFAWQAKAPFVAPSKVEWGIGFGVLKGAESSFGGRPSKQRTGRTPGAFRQNQDFSRPEKVHLSGARTARTPRNKTKST